MILFSNNLKTSHKFGRYGSRQHHSMSPLLYITGNQPNTLNWRRFKGQVSSEFLSGINVN